MSKALCIKKSDLFLIDIDQSELDVYVKDSEKLFSLKPTLEDRSTCETDPSLLQIIPYITLFDKKTGQVFVYRRGKAGGEQRLSGKCSIGLGGHMEAEPDESKSLMELIAHEAARELEEEVGLEFSAEIVEEIFSKLSQSNCGIMYNTRTEVDRVHIAVSFFLGVDPDSLKGHEENVITRGRWMSFDEITQATEAGEFEIEHWSRMVVQTYQHMAK